ncbi:MAG: YjbH domain-containing protein [Gemmatimonadota bacterium]|nr:YjbH domain-containing protein [Gemmatimonadota bacterium]
MIFSVPRSVRIALLLALPAAVVLPGAAKAQETYPQTMYWGAGLIDIPVAYVSPVTGDFALNFSGKTFHGAKASPGFAVLDGLNTNGSISFSFFGRLETGISIYSDNPEWGLFAQGLLLNEENFRPKSGLVRWVPSVAVGMRNIGPYDHIDRFTIGYDLYPGTVANPGKQHLVDSLHQNFKTGNTVYGVATKSFALSELNPGWGKTTVSLTVGYGNGLFKNDGGLGSAYAANSWNGAFGGVKVDLFPTAHSTLSFMAENNSWDYNVGAAYEWHGLRAGAYWTELGASRADTISAASKLYGYSKFSFTLGWQNNVLALLRGHSLERRVAELERQRQLLNTEITARQQRIASLELEINRYQAQNLLELEQRRATAETELRSEREALQRLEERLRKLEQDAPPSTTPH